ncbi:MAG: hypothetical protein E6Q78_05150 [Rhodoferax sp.]|nr:MAG: hypothetical protein E6Q78_05150 [Rhodoferax sp.]
MSTTPGYIQAFEQKRDLTREELTELTFVNSYLSHSKDAAVLEAMRKRRANPFTKECDALWSGMYELKKLADEKLILAVKSGQILFCFEGTTVFKGGAA